MQDFFSKVIKLYCIESNDQLPVDEDLLTAGEELVEVDESLFQDLGDLDEEINS